MRQILIAFGMAGLFVVGAQAAAVCASPAEMKALQAAVLEQQLAAAAQSCHAIDDYTRFVAAYRDAIVKSDQTVRAFFQHQRSGETYGSYKSRIAHDISLKSQRDPKFCATAETVFDLALGRGKSSEPPTLVETGYEGCRPVPDKPLMAAATQPRPPVAAASKAIKPPVKAAAAQPVWDADHVLALLHPVDIPVPTPAPPHAVRALALAHSASSVPATTTAKPHLAAVQTPLSVIVPHHAVSRELGAPPVPAMREPHPEVGHPAARYTAVEHPRWRYADQGTNAGGNVPNAYLPGAQWVGAETDGPPRERFNEDRSVMYRGPDGRWYERVGRRDHWDEDE